MTDQNITDDEEQRYAELQKIALDFARAGDTDELRKMITAGMPVNLADEKGQTLLMLASYNGNPDTTRMLLEYGAEVDQKNDHGQTPLGGVAFKGYPEIAELLIEHGADLNADNGGGMTPIHYASMFGRTQVVKVLEKHGASLKRKDEKSGKFMPFLARLVGKVRGLFSC
ncbi:Cj1386 family hemin-binding protein [soil metagenome]